MVALLPAVMVPVRTARRVGHGPKHRVDDLNVEKLLNSQQAWRIMDSHQLSYQDQRIIGT